MPIDTPAPPEPPTPIEPSLVVDGTERGVLRRGGMVIGSFDTNGVVLDLGWCRHAGFNVRILDDRAAGDNHRGGVAFERLAEEPF
jgi:hypothetical protein